MPVPTEAQKAMFDALSDEEQLNMLQQAIADGIESGNAGTLDMTGIIAYPIVIDSI